MTKRFYKNVASTDVIQFPGGYPAGPAPLAVLDDLDPRLQEIFDYAPTAASAQAAVDTLVTAGKIKNYGRLTQVSKFHHVWAVALTLNQISAGEVARCRPGFAGRVAGTSFVATADATTAAKAASLGLEIDPKVAPGVTTSPDYADEVHTLTETGSPVGGNFDANIAGVNVLAIAYNTTKAAFQAKIDATALLGKVVVGGTDTTGPWTLTFTGSLANTHPAATVITGHLTGGTSPAVTPTVTQIGATRRVVGASGNPATLDLTSANVSDGGTVGGETIATGANAQYGDFTKYDEIVLTAASVTAFVEGAGIVSVVLQAT
jgi:hypothetical protein